VDLNHANPLTVFLCGDVMTGRGIDQSNQDKAVARLDFVTPSIRRPRLGCLRLRIATPCGALDAPKPQRADARAG
jgi:hypothetical protein